MMVRPKGKYNIQNGMQPLRTIRLGISGFFRFRFHLCFIEALCFTESFVFLVPSSEIAYLFDIFFSVFFICCSESGVYHLYINFILCQNKSMPVIVFFLPLILVMMMMMIKFYYGMIIKKDFQQFIYIYEIKTLYFIRG